MLFAEILTQEIRNEMTRNIFIELERAELPQLPYSHEEIYLMWREAKRPNEQIQILADMCECSKREIYAVIKAYRKEKDPPLPKSKKLTDPQREISKSTCDKVLKDFACGCRIEEISHRYDIARDSVLGIISKMNLGGEKQCSSVKS